MDQQTGQARSRARGRARARGQQQQSTQQRRPGEERSSQQQQPQQTRPPPGFSSQQQQSRAQAPVAPPPVSGRASHRGGVRVEATPGGDDVTSGMKALSVGPRGPGGDNGGAAVGRGAMRGRRQVSTEVVRTRPECLDSKQGTSGQRVKLTSNFFPLRTDTEWCLYQYRVDFAPEEDRTMVRRAMLRDHKEVLGGYIFDGTVMFSSNRLHPDPLEVFSKRTSDEATIRITIRMVGTLDAGDYQYLQLFNIILRKCLGYLNLQLVGRNFFDAGAKISIPEHNLELWPGYLTSIRQHETSILLGVEITHKVMRQDTVLDFLTEIANHAPRDFKGTFTREILGSIVLTDYNNRTYRIDDVDYDVSPTSTFKFRSGEEVSYVDYYRKKYQVRITQNSQPMLVSRSKPREQRAGAPDLVYLVPELCRLTGLTDKMRENFHLMRALAEHTRVNPDARIEKLFQFSRRLLNEPQVVGELTKWKMNLERQLVEFGGRILPEERIVQGRPGQEIRYGAGPQTDWTRELRSNPMLNIGEITEWVVMCPTRSKRDAQSFVGTLIRAAAGMQFMLPQPFFYDLQDDKAATYVNSLGDVLSKKRPQLIMCIVPNNRVDRYSAIKKKCCVDHAVPTQVMVARNLASKGVMSIATKVAIQMNCKIGGAPWTVEIPLSGLMVFGFDVCHDTSQKGKSYGALVGSLDRVFSRYYSAVSPHTTGEELSSYLSANVGNALRKYLSLNKCLPQRIIIYRDGVGEGQIPYVFNHEVGLLMDNLNEIYGKLNIQLKLAFVVVTKRINTRFFLGNRNPPPGTVVDDCVTLPERYDFFLVSQSVRQGTVSPTSFNVISDNVGLDPDKIQRLSYKLTHLYYNWSGTVRVPAPCQYAHKLAFLVGQALHRSPNPALDDKLYFL